jgi:hypothetical protein
MLCWRRWVGASSISVSLLLGAQAAAAQSVAAAQSAAAVRGTGSPSEEQAQTRSVARAAPEPRPVTAGRVVLEGVGAAVGAASALVPGLIFVGLTQGPCESERDRGCRIGHSAHGGAIIALGSAVLLMPAGTYIAGNAMGGQGGYGWTLLGSSIGIVTGVLGSVPLFTMEQDAGALLGTLVLTGSILAGNVLGYELSSASAARRQPANAARPGLTVYPDVRISSGRLALGVVGGF